MALFGSCVLFVTTGVSITLTAPFLITFIFVLVFINLRAFFYNHIFRGIMHETKKNSGAFLSIVASASRTFRGTEILSAGFYKLIPAVLHIF